MKIRLGYDIRFTTVGRVPFIAMLNVHPSRTADLLEPDILHADPGIQTEQYFDSFGNICVRLVAPGGQFRIHTSTLIQDSGQPDPVSPQARQMPVDELPPETLRYLLGSRYCETDLLSNMAVELFGNTKPGWSRVASICAWVNQHVTFGYPFANPTKTALDVLNTKQGVCRDFQHLAVAFCRCMNIPARYATGYLGDIGVPATPPMDFSAWFEAYLDHRWWTFDARHNAPRIGRVLIAVGRDAADVAVTTSFGAAPLLQFDITADEVQEESASASA
jgi:transglutaminase-like putative cysteine protease